MSNKGKKINVNPSSLKNLTSKFGFKKGSVPWNKGEKGLKPFMDISGLKNVTKKERAERGFKKGNIPWNKGKSYPRIKGKNHWKWQGGCDKSLRKGQEYKLFIRKILERDKFTCKTCGEYGVGLNVHHIKGWTKYPELRYDPENCITLCTDCHKKIHGFVNRKPIAKHLDRL